jgi:glycosyltransferase involved in cell wall biosynthesis
VPGSVSPVIERHRIVTSFVQRLPAAATRYRHYLPLFPAAVRRLPLDGFDLVISLSHCVAKAVRVPPRALHLCYCFTPMRYVWDLEEDYASGSGWLTRLALPPAAAALRRWDRRTDGVAEFVAISHHIADRIRRAYGRAADVIYPPVELERFRIAADVDDYYLVVSALVPYKRVDLAVAAATRLGRRLVIVGRGPEEARLRAMAGPGVTFLGWRPDAEVAELYARCRAVLFPSVEDFGIVPLEAAAAGRPTIALAQGGALETMVGLDADEPPTAVFFGAQTVDALAEAMTRLEGAAGRFQPAALRARAARFDRPKFARRIREYVEARLGEFQARRAC